MRRLLNSKVRVKRNEPAMIQTGWIAEYPRRLTGSGNSLLQGEKIVGGLHDAPDFLSTFLSSLTSVSRWTVHIVRVE
jgi:hypothetical protein